MKKYISGLFLISLMVSSCSQQEVINPNEDNEIHFRAFYPGTESRVSGNSFENGDVMGVYMTEYDEDKATPLQASGNFVTNARTLFNGTTWQCVPAVYWGDGKYDIFGYYPYDEVESVDEYKFTVLLDQSETSETPKAYEASDFLWTKVSGVNRMDEVPLSFSHLLSRIVVKLIPGEEYEGDIPENVDVVIHNTVPQGLIDLAYGVVTKDFRASEKSIKARKEDTGVYAAILIPQRIESHRPLIEIISNGVSYMVESSFIFRSGVQHTITVTLDNNPERVKVEIGGEITDWK